MSEQAVDEDGEHGRQRADEQAVAEHRGQRDVEQPGDRDRAEAGDDEDVADQDAGGERAAHQARDRARPSCGAAERARGAASTSWTST